VQTKAVTRHEEERPRGRREKSRRYTGKMWIHFKFD